MKKILSLMLVFCICFCIVGCKKTAENGLSTNASQTESETTKDEKLELVKQIFGHDDMSKSEYDLSKFGVIKDYNLYEDLFISSDGTLYKLGNFSDGTNFKKIDSNVKFVKFSNGCIISEQNEVYIYNDDEFTVSLYSGRGYVNCPHIKSNDYINSIHLIIETEKNISGFVENKKLYIYDDIYGDIQLDTNYNEIPKYCIHKFDDDEEIEYLIDYVIKTNKGYYYLEGTLNVSEFDDVPTTCEYNLKKFENISDDIEFFKVYDDNRVIIFDKNNHLFLYGNYWG